MCQSLCLFFSSLFLSEEVSSDLPPSREQRVEQKRFYFDVGSNTRGVYLRISEVRGSLQAVSPISRHFRWHGDCLLNPLWFVSSMNLPSLGYLLYFPTYYILFQNGVVRT